MNQLTVNNVNPTALKESVLNDEIDQYTMVDFIAQLLADHYKSELDGIVNRLLVKESILSINGQTRKHTHAVFYALELLEKAKANKLKLSFNRDSRFSALQFESPRVEY